MVRTASARITGRRVARLFALALCVALAACGGQSPGQGAPSAALLAGATVVNGTATINAARSDYTIIRTSIGYTLTDKTSGSVQVLTGITRIVFTDASVNLTAGDNVSALPFATQKLLVELYVAFFNRVPDADGLDYWVSQLNAGRSIEQLADNFYTAAIQYSSLTGYSASMTNADFVRVIYKNVLGRSGTTAPPDADVQYWAGELTNGKKTRGSLIKFMLGSAHSFAGDATWGWVPQLLNNKFATAYYFSAQQGLVYNNGADSITKTMAIAAAVTSTDTTAAVKLVGVDSSGLLPFAMQSGGAICTLNGCNGNVDLAGSGGGDGGGGDGGAGAGGGLSEMRNVVATAYKPNGAILDKAELQSGLVSIYPHSNKSAFILEFAGKSNGEYYDEAKKAWVSFANQKLHVMVPALASGNHVSANSFTEAAYRYALKQYGSEAALDATKMLTANDFVLTQVNGKLPAKYQLVDISMLPTLINDNKNSNTLNSDAPGVLGATLASTALAADSFSNGALATPALSFASQLARDISTNNAITGSAAGGDQAYGISVAADLSTASQKAVTTFGMTSLQTRVGTTVASFAGLYSGTYSYYDAVSKTSGSDTWSATVDSAGKMTVTPSGSGNVSAGGALSGFSFVGYSGGFLTGRIILSGSGGTISGSFSFSIPGSYDITGTFSGIK